MRIFAREKHQNIIQVIAVYQWNDQINFVFPFYPQNLHDILHSSSPQNPFDDDDKGVKHWLWTQMVGVADGLKTIHSPRHVSVGSDSALSFVGFHYDLKPANILVAFNRCLKITDFGQSWIKERSTDQEAYGNYRGGSLVYRPPEACPPREVIERTQRMGEILQQQTKEAAYNLHGLTKFHNVYDVWSLGCIMIEVITFIFGGGPPAVDKFKSDRDNENTGIAFHNGQNGSKARLKQSVENAIVGCTSDEQCETLGLATSDYMHGLSELLRNMLDVNQGSRCTSDHVVEELAKLRDDYEDNDTPEDELARRIKHRPLDGYDEVLSCLKSSFMHMLASPTSWDAWYP